MKLNVIHLLFCLFQEQENYSILSYESIDEFYSRLGYDLESEWLLRDLGINGTSGLAELLTDYNNLLENEITKAVFSDKWL
ncbi:hypothetical protein EFP_118 [Enterococcus phage EF24C]|jgi:hypothetical protein|uniref:Uncharacterized protein n=4 Tax=Kochikohdavirus TaxID=2560160 RepID=A8E2H0_BPPHE|nr:hypothetical protein EFP_gp118 [Enterococcus phage EF24C]YP_009147210.1 hypothetical protein [Enterococcus phage ECP3]QPW37299.1 hypothetical protein [Enterococcus phage PBEF129]QVW28016.1 hypothetical protein [Enterococcus phage MDA2]BBE37391.1 hypothetical protein PHIM1EF22_1180 [Enterococcus phage phiM1EF22]AII28569.1 hypothetical protein [Enterococcus phage ECP3]BAF81386.1 hypothetical protein EFP_118 [Enterococcus phage EF24C]